MDHSKEVYKEAEPRRFHWEELPYYQRVSSDTCSTLQLLDSPKILRCLLDLPERPGDLVKK